MSHDIMKYTAKTPHGKSGILQKERLVFADWWKVHIGNRLANTEKQLRSAPAFINFIRSALPQKELMAVLTGEDKAKIAGGALQLVFGKDGAVLAQLRDPKTGKIVKHIPLQEINASPGINAAMTGLALQMQMSELFEKIEKVQEAIAEVRQGLEGDRLATAYSCRAKFSQITAIENATLKKTALLRLAMDCEDSRHALMQSQNVNVDFIKKQPKTFWNRLLSGEDQAKIDARMSEVRESLYAINTVSVIEAASYMELGEPDAARLSMRYYGGYIRHTFLEEEGFVDRLDSLDASNDNYWSTSIPEIEKRILALPSAICPKELEA